MTKRPTDGTKESTKPAPAAAKPTGANQPARGPALAPPIRTNPFGVAPAAAAKPAVLAPARPTIEGRPFADSGAARPTKTDPFGAKLPGETGGQKGWSDSTMMVQIPDDPGIGKLQAELPQDNLGAMQKVLARCEVSHVSPALTGFNFKNFVQNLKGISKVELGEVKLYALLTRHNAFILANLIAEQLHDLVKGLMDLHLGDRIMLKDGDKVRYLYKVPSQQMERLRTIANQNRLLTANGFPFRDLAQFRQKLGACVAPVGFEELRSFAARVMAVSSLYTDRDSNGYHLLMLNDGMAWQLFVNPKAEVPGAVTLVHGSARLALVGA
ncbi:MAG TPA: hypothetical protein VGK67_19720 [Myxococcales bacterium]|jgi:hypothetical protein